MTLMIMEMKLVFVMKKIYFQVQLMIHIYYYKKDEVVILIIEYCDFHPFHNQRVKMYLLFLLNTIYFGTMMIEDNQNNKNKKEVKDMIKTIRISERKLFF